jgi:hypothetical protein
MRNEHYIPMLRVGNAVEWRGGFGNDDAEIAYIKCIEICEYGQKYGMSVDSVPWQEVSNRVVVTLENGFWAYGTQIKPTNDEH